MYRAVDTHQRVLIPVKSCSVEETIEFPLIAVQMIIYFHIIHFFHCYSNILYHSRVNFKSIFLLRVNKRHNSVVPLYFPGASAAINIGFRIIQLPHVFVL